MRFLQYRPARGAWRPAAWTLVVVTLLAAGCEWLEMSARFAVESRTRLVRSIDAVNDAQEFALDGFRAGMRTIDAVFYGIGTPLSERRTALERNFADVALAASRIPRRIGDMERQCDRLERAWSREIETYTDATYRVHREVHLDRTRKTCDRTLATMRATDARVQPLVRDYRTRLRGLRRNFTERGIVEHRTDFRDLHPRMQYATFALTDSISAGNELISLLGDAVLEAPE
jgi:hypothetical protein